MKKEFLALLFSVFFIIASCSEDNDNNPIDTPETVNWEDYFPLAEGNWWVYENYDTDENYNQIEFTSKDSVVVIAQLEVAGKTAWEVTTFSSDPEYTPSTGYYYGEGSKLYYYESDDPMLGSTAQWMLMIDFSLTSNKSVLDTSFSDLDLGVGSFSGDISVGLNKGSNDNIVVMGETHETKSFILSVDMVGTFVFFGIPGTFESYTNSESYYINGIGLGMTKTHSRAIDEEGEANEYSQNILVDYHVVK